MDCCFVLFFIIESRKRKKNLLSNLFDKQNRKLSAMLCDCLIEKPFHDQEFLIFEKCRLFQVLFFCYSRFQKLENHKNLSKEEILKGSAQFVLAEVVE